MEIKKKVNNPAELISTLFFSRTQAHIFHLQTSSYARHNALGDYYDSIVGLTDSLVEAYQGTNGVLKGYTSESRFGQLEVEVIPYFEKLLLYIEKARSTVGEDSDLQNTVDEIVSLVKSTLYKLKHLK